VPVFFKFTASAELICVIDALPAFSKTRERFVPSNFINTVDIEFGADAIHTNQSQPIVNVHHQVPS
jgi:hypothetical protein